MARKPTLGNSSDIVVGADLSDASLAKLPPQTKAALIETIYSAMQQAYSGGTNTTHPDFIKGMRELDEQALRDPQTVAGAFRRRLQPRLGKPDDETIEKLKRAAQIKLAQPNLGTKKIARMLGESDEAYRQRISRNAELWQALLSSDDIL